MLRARIWSLALPLGVALAGCATTDGGNVGEDEGAATDLPPEKVDAVSQVPWEPVGAGVSYKAFGGGRNALLVYGGYTAQDVYVQRWTNELLRERADRLGVGHVYAVRGPNQSGYANHEIANSRLAAHLAASDAESIYVVAHSSGTYVADELFGMLGDDALRRVTFFNLDGGATDARVLHALSAAYFVFACDGTIGRCSHNASTMRSFGAEYAALGGPIEVHADGTACGRDAGGLWCMHDALITTRPHNPLAYDLRRDYTDFAGDRAVVTSYFDALGR